MQEKTEILEQKIYDFLLYLYTLLSKYPKFEKFSLQSSHYMLLKQTYTSTLRVLTTEILKRKYKRR